MRPRVGNDEIRRRRLALRWSQQRLAHEINRAMAADGLAGTCTAARVGRWEHGVATPGDDYRPYLGAALGCTLADLGLEPQHNAELARLAASPRPVVLLQVPETAGKSMVVSLHPLAAEAELFDTMELAQMAEASDTSQGTLDVLEEAVDLLCRAYPSTPAAVLRDRTRQRLGFVMRLLGGRLTLHQHRELLVHAGWLAALLGCVHYDLGERERAEAARQAAYQLGKQAGHGELMGWAFEMAAWFALVEERYEDAVAAALRGQSVAGTSNAMVQLVLQEAKGDARLGRRREARAALDRGGKVLEGLPVPAHPAHHFVFDRTKWAHYTSTIHTWLDDNDRAKEHALEVIAKHARPDGTTSAPMRTANAHMDLAIVHARRGDLDAAVDKGLRAFTFERQSLADLVFRAGDLDRILQSRYRGERLAAAFQERLLLARRSLQGTA